MIGDLRARQMGTWARERPGRLAGDRRVVVNGLVVTGARIVTLARDSRDESPSLWSPAGNGSRIWYLA